MKRAEPKGPLAVFGYDYFQVEWAKQAHAVKPGLLKYEGLWGGGEEYAYEVLNFADGKRNAQEIRDAVSAEYGPVPLELVVEYLKALEKIGVVEQVKLNWKIEIRCVAISCGRVCRAQTEVCATGVLASRFAQRAGVRVDGGGDESIAEDAGGEGLADGYGRRAFDRAGRRVGAGEDGVDLRDGFAHLWMGPVVAGAH